MSAATASAGSSRSADMFIYDLPSGKRQELCAILDEQSIWSDLATAHMGYTKSDLQILRRTSANGNSPSDELLNMWGDQNHTVTELFILLYRVQQYHAMDIIKEFVDRKYYRLITVNQPDLSNLLKKGSATSEKLVNQSRSDNCTTTSTNGDDDDDNGKSAVDFKKIDKYVSQIPQINYSELVDATNNWDERQVLGKGGFGTVYRGRWKFTDVAIKRIEYHGTGMTNTNKIEIQQSLTELKHLNSCRHDNILPLYGYSINGKQPCLVYQLMTGGSLETRLKSNKQNPLSWEDRFNIAKGTARGLQYLHTFTETPLIHGDIKPGNILIDGCNQPKIGDFGLARKGPNSLNNESMTVSRVYGTRPYIPEDFRVYKTLSTKVDTFSYGVVLFELITGLRAFDNRRAHKLLSKHIFAMLQEKRPIEELIDRSYPMDAQAFGIFKMLYKVGIACIADASERRPEMFVVLQHLEND